MDSKTEYSRNQYKRIIIISKNKFFVPDSKCFLFPKNLFFSAILHCDPGGAREQSDPGGAREQSDSLNLWTVFGANTQMTLYILQHIMGI